MMGWLYKLLRIPPKPKKVVVRSPSPCGNDPEHYYWAEVHKWPCPVCAGIEKRKKLRQDEDRLARKIAANVVRMSSSRRPN